MKRKSALSLFATVALVAAVATTLAQPPYPPEKPEALVPVISSADKPSSTKVFRYYDKFAIKPHEIGNAVDTFRTTESGEAEFLATSNALVQKLAKAESDSQRQEIRHTLTEVLGKQFDVRQTRHKHEIDALEAQVQKLKELVKKREENRSEIISRRLEQMIRDSQGLGF